MVTQCLAIIIRDHLRALSRTTKHADQVYHNHHMAGNLARAARQATDLEHHTLWNSIPTASIMEENMPFSQSSQIANPLDLIEKSNLNPARVALDLGTICDFLARTNLAASESILKSDARTRDEEKKPSGVSYRWDRRLFLNTFTPSPLTMPTLYFHRGRHRSYCLIWSSIPTTWFLAFDIEHFGDKGPRHQGS